MKKKRGEDKKKRKRRGRREERYGNYLVGIYDFEYGFMTLSMDTMMILYGNYLSMELVWKCLYGY